MYKYDASVRIYSPNKKPKDGSNYIAYTYNSLETELSFNIAKTNEKKPAQCSCEIHGVDVKTYHLIDSSLISKGVQTKYIEILFHSKFGSEMIFTGLINEVSYHFDSGKQTMSIVFDEGLVKFNNAKRSISTTSGVSLMNVLGQIGEQFGYSIAPGVGIDLNSIPVRKTAITGTIRECLDAVVPSSLNYFVKGFQILIVGKGRYAESSSITLDLSKGLKEYPVKTKRKEKKKEIIRYNIKTVYTPGLDIGTTIKIPYDKETGYYLPEALGNSKFYSFIIRKFSKEFNGTNFVASLECEMIANG